MIHYHVMRHRTSKIWGYMAPHTVAKTSTEAKAKEIATKDATYYVTECCIKGCEGR